MAGENCSSGGCSDQGAAICLDCRYRDYNVAKGHGFGTVRIISPGNSDEDIARSTPKRRRRRVKLNGEPRNVTILKKLRFVSVSTHLS